MGTLARRCSQGRDLDVGRCSPASRPTNRPTIPAATVLR